MHKSIDKPMKNGYINTVGRTKRERSHSMKRAIINTKNDGIRVVNLPFVVNDEILKVIASVEGVTFTRPNPWGRYEIGYEVGRCFEPQLIDRNVQFALDEYIKATEKAARDREESRAKLYEDLRAASLRKKDEERNEERAKDVQ